MEIYIDDETKLTLHGLQLYYCKLAEAEKNRKLNDLLDALEFNQVVIFVSKVARAKELNRLLKECNFPSICIHGGMKQEERISQYNCSYAAAMKLNIANPSTGLQKVFEIEDDKKLMPFFDKRMAAEVAGETLGDEFKGYIFRITGGNDKQGFPMKQGVLTNGRVKLLFKKGMSCFRERRSGTRKRKSVRGCIVGNDLATLQLVIAKKGPEDVPGLTDDNRPRRLGPKRAANIRKLFNLEKKDDVKQFVVRRLTKEGGKKKKAPKIQRLVTRSLLQRKRTFRADTRKHMQVAKKLKAEYTTRLSEYRQEQKEMRAAEVAKKKKEKAA